MSNRAVAQSEPQLGAHEAEARRRRACLLEERREEGARHRLHRQVRGGAARVAPRAAGAGRGRHAGLDGGAAACRMGRRDARDAHRVAQAAQAQLDECIDELQRRNFHRTEADALRPRLTRCGPAAAPPSVRRLVAGNVEGAASEGAAAGGAAAGCRAKHLTIGVTNSQMKSLRWSLSITTSFEATTDACLGCKIDNNIKAIYNKYYFPRVKNGRCVSSGASHLSMRMTRKNWTKLNREV